MNKLSTKLNTLSTCGVTDWLADSNASDQPEVLIEALAMYFFDGKYVTDFAPSCDDASIYFHFVDSGYDFTWYAMVTGEFLDDLREFLEDVVYLLNYEQPVISKEEFRVMVIEWCEQWQKVCELAFKQALKKSIAIS
jgi:hypothetical protein